MHAVSVFNAVELVCTDYACNERVACRGVGVNIEYIMRAMSACHSVVLGFTD